MVRHFAQVNARRLHVVGEAAVDAETESQIRDALRRVTAGRTVLIVAHRTSTIQAADQIIVIERGSVVETGTYDELASVDSAFARLCRLQENAVW